MRPPGLPLEKSVRQEATVRTGHGTTEDEMARWQHGLDGRESE